MYNFEKHLQENEVILYQSRAVPGKGGKAVGGSLFLIIFSLFINGCLVYSFLSNNNFENGIFGFIIVFLIVSVFFILGVYNLIYNFFLKKKQVSDDFYCLTNIRVFKYESKIDKLVFGYIANYEQIYCSNVKDNFGNLHMEIIMENNDNTLQNINTLKELLTNPDPENMPFIIFESIENPNYVMNLIVEAKEKLKKQI